MEDNTKAHYSYHHPDIGLNADFRNILKENNVQIVTASDAIILTMWGAALNY